MIHAPGWEELPSDGRQRRFFKVFDGTRCVAYQCLKTVLDDNAPYGIREAGPDEEPPDYIIIAEGGYFRFQNDKIQIETTEISIGGVDVDCLARKAVKRMACYVDALENAARIHENSENLTPTREAV